MIRFFSFGMNQLSEFPESFYQLKKLTDLQIDRNQFKEIDERILNLENLVNLFVNDNQIFRITNAG